MLQSLVYLYKDVLKDSRRAASFKKAATILATNDEAVGVLDTPEKAHPLFAAGKQKLPGLAEGTYNRVKEWMETGLPAELEDYEA